jgi:hypothetical protein
MSELFIPIKFNTLVQLKTTEIGINIDEILLGKIKKNLENMCSKHGYIKNNSIKIVKRSIGRLIVSQFNGNISYNLQCIAEICNPAQGSILKCKIKAKNSLGLLAEGFYDNIPILQIIIPKLSAGIKSEIDINKVSIGEEIKIEVCGKKFLLYDKHISIIGRAIKDDGINVRNIVDIQSNSDIDDDKTNGNDDDDILEFADDDIKSDYDSNEEEDIDDNEDDNISIEEDDDNDIDDDFDNFAEEENIE